jgi:hypothetical protein
LLGLALLSFFLATAALASVPGPGSILAVSPPGHGPVTQPFTVTFTGVQHCTGQGWGEVRFYLDGSLAGSAPRLSGCSASLQLTPSLLTPVPPPGAHLVTASLATPSGQLASSGLTATWVIDAGVVTPSPSPSPTPTTSPTATPTPGSTPTPTSTPTATPTPTPAPGSTPSPSPSATPQPGPTPHGPPPSAGFPSSGVAEVPQGGGVSGPGTTFDVAGTGGTGGPPAEVVPASIAWNQLPYLLALLALATLLAAALLGRSLTRAQRSEA